MKSCGNMANGNYNPKRSIPSGKHRKMWRGKGVNRAREGANEDKTGTPNVQTNEEISYMVDWAAQWPKTTTLKEKEMPLIIVDDDEWKIWRYKRSRDTVNGAFSS